MSLVIFIFIEFIFVFLLFVIKYSLVIFIELINLKIGELLIKFGRYLMLRIFGIFEENRYYDKNIFGIKIF